ncbi:hypothetical protein HDE69_004815 [Pedobacter cryoconitis]|uniref:Uncharacterized protein n=1 Tax=Pedobacter cryoconitis TaxID=188932 RepID=A0A7W8YY74_9SPHI|nr:hypothetical protein [Pedobacter cryoconitis]MBB5623728.1 hypothetical protein [Pedobacter cryoconitis]
MDFLDEVLLLFWSSLNNHDVKYIMVGGFATRFHGFNRSTDDLDIWLYDTLDNRKNLSAAPFWNVLTSPLLQSLKI